MSSGDSGVARASIGWRLVAAWRCCWARPCCSRPAATSGFRPLYATVGGGHDVAEAMKQVEFAPIPGKVGQRIRNEMIFQTTGGGNPLPPAYRLEVVLSENLTSTLVRSTGEAEGQIYAVQASFRLIDHKQKKVVFEGTSHARAGFERFVSIYSNVRARDDAENRVARTIADDLKSRLAAYLSRAT